MDVNHVGQQVLFMSNLPLELNVQFVTIMATKMPFIGQGMTRSRAGGEAGGVPGSGRRKRRDQPLVR